jgi:hypothetical protein
MSTIEQESSRGTKIRDLMQIAAEQRDQTWLAQSLQAAIELELSTIPPYLCAMWSIKDQSAPAYELILSIVLEEMLHMSLACNMLTTIGGTPDITGTVPTYPGPLPGGVRPGLIVSLGGLTKQRVADIFMQIEYPEGGPVTLVLGQTYPTIGAFYDAITAAFLALPTSAFTGQRQLTAQIDSNSLVAINSCGDAEHAISEIKEQGEGSSQSPLAVDFGDELAHYYKFAEIYHGRKLVKTPGGWKYQGEPIPFPDVYPMAEVPPGGYPAQSRDFDVQFSAVLNSLQSAWAKGSQDDLSNAITSMFNLGDLATALMKQPLPGGHGNYGPDFRYIR